MTAITRTIAVDLLRINPSNDRHGEVSSEAEAISLLLQKLARQMRGLARDIAATGQLFMFPLVRPDGAGRFTVFDGNRRLTCLKLLLYPELAPSEEWRKFFKQPTDTGANIQLPNEITCLVSEDQDWIDDYLYRIHTGSQNGVGQIRWNNPAKSNFIQRTGKSTRIDLPAMIEQKLKEANLIDEATKFKHTNLQRLLSSEEFRSRVGISVTKGHITFIRDQDRTTKALARIVKDLSTGYLNLNHLLKNEEKRKYLDKLERQGALPTVADTLSEKVDFKTRAASTTTTNANKGKQEKKSVRHYLVRREDALELDSTGARHRATDI